MVGRTISFNVQQYRVVCRLAILFEKANEIAEIGGLEPYCEVGIP